MEFDEALQKRQQLTNPADPNRNFYLVYAGKRIDDRARDTKDRLDDLLLEDSAKNDENELSGEKELEDKTSAVNYTPVSYITDNSTELRKAQFTFDKNNLSTDDIAKWFSQENFQQPYIIEDEKQFTIYVEVQPDTQYKDPSIQDVLLILQRNNLLLTDNAKEELLKQYLLANDEMFNFIVTLKI